ncbi:uncharacterized protein LOC128202398 [Galleria mellonella]|uniref:Uncharacterized protein LOC128202398 n=2 Tax=Galleria mellonella TaxID=7137 RepID=A0ABM3N4P1_GALME|nr:uncharacterized protein LOC128202398 [Galleria mellonella]
MAEERELVKKRGSFKGRLTAFINYLHSLTDEPLSLSDARELQLRMGKIESLYEQYDQVQLRLECIVDNIEEQFKERSEFESQYFKAIAQAQGLQNINEGSMSSIGSDKGTRMSNHKLVKLPTIQLPKFCGSYDNYLEFRDTFTSLIHNNDEIDEINKFHYLRASLEGSAAVVIQSVEFSSKNYAVAWKLLCDRFDNKRLLIQNHVSSLFNIEVITKESSVTLKRLIDQVNKNLRALESLGEPVKHWDTLLIYIITHKLDNKTFRKWEEFKGRMEKDASITFDIFLQFIRSSADLFETLELSRVSQINSTHKSTGRLKSMVSIQGGHTNQNSNTAESHQRVCPKCKGDHNLANCPQFLALSIEARLKLLPSYKVCFNCFRAGHFANLCKKSGCKICKRRHNSLIHVTSDQPVRNENKITSVNTPSASTSSVASHNVALTTHISNYNKVQCDVLLSTALIKLYDDNNREHIVRAILDSGSTSSLITETLCQRLNLMTCKVDKSILGINNATSCVGKSCHVQMTSLNNNYSSEVQCYVLPSITSNIPSHEVNISNIDIPTDICLADPTFFIPAHVDILIGADLFWDLVGTRRITLGKKKPVLCETKLGWIISGPIFSHHVTTTDVSELRCNLNKIDSTSNQDFDDIRTDLTRFWQLEEINSKHNYLPEEKKCEEHFIANTTRLDDGRFCVRIPLKQTSSVLGESIQRAEHCLYSLEHRLKSKPNLSEMYHSFMSEYELLGHMSKCEQPKLEQDEYFIPHHGVMRDSSTTTKLRVVFNASSPTTSGVSYNDIQMIGPIVQDDLVSILLRFRQHKYVLSADVEKMYRQIIVHPSDRHLQQILWRSNTNKPIQKFILNTVTYGTSSAPFLATRCLKQLSIECKNDKIAEIIEHDFYVDDLLTGGDDLTEVQAIRKEVTDVLASACMPLRKWKSNEPRLIIESPNNNISSIDLNIGHNDDDPNKLLGLSWHANSDELCFPIGSLIPDGNTKRDILSSIARIFDPLGLLAPCIINMKLLLQQLWIQKLSWDEPLNYDLNKNWKRIREALPLLNKLRIPRIVICDSHKLLELHVFSDASERAYGACIYVRSVSDFGKVLVRLLMAKSRVAPIKPTTIPRLELCGALIAARLYDKVVTSLRLKINKVYCWTDSTIVLSWLRMLPSRLQPFVRNRVAEILERTENCTWRHVPTDENSADLISRGVDISNLQSLELWWSGPAFLRDDFVKWPPQPKHVEVLPEIKQDHSLNAIVHDVSSRRLIEFNRFSNYLRLVRSVAYVLRFINSCKRLPEVSIFLSEKELRYSLILIISNCQYESFPEYKLLLNKESLPKKSPLLKFNVFLDENNIMRVGGRIDNSNYSDDKKHPIILQSTHIFTKLLFAFEHKRLLHAGPQLLLASIRESYWPIGGRNLAKTCYHNCIKCTRIKGKVVTPLMGNLPQQRLLSGGYPFMTVGVDYAGPIMCANRQGRGCRLVKVYIAVFVCFTTKAIHLELVGDLTSNNYLLALRRFISRRGKPVNIYSDNGTSFVGAYNDLSKFLKANFNSLGESAANDGINFHFIPAYAPHFGGLWEAGVRSTKYHLQRVLGNCTLTYEELNTTLVQIEAVLNSRPLTPLSSDPADYNPLTPGHFLIGRSLTSLPERDYRLYSTNNLTRFQRIEQLRQHFWTRWSKEYIAELQQRVKWRSCKDNLKLDTLVVIKEDNLPPLKWKLGRIVEVHPGPDGIVRVADIKTSTGVIRRAFSKICPLPSLSG